MTRKNLKRNTKVRRYSSWAIPPASAYHQVINHSFSESGGTVTYTSYDVIKDDTNISRPTSIRLQFCSSVPTTFVIQGGTSTDGSDVLPINWIMRCTSNVLLSSTTVRNVSLRFPKYEDFDVSACWRIISTGPLTITGICGFSAKNGLETSS